MFSNLLHLKGDKNIPENYRKEYSTVEKSLLTKINNHSRIKIDQIDVTCFIISLFTAQHVSNVSTSIFRSLRLIVDLSHGLY